MGISRGRGNGGYLSPCIFEYKMYPICLLASGKYMKSIVLFPQAVGEASAPNLRRPMHIQLKPFLYERFKSQRF